jgi:hypothetical protein
VTASLELCAHIVYYEAFHSSAFPCRVPQQYSDGFDEPLCFLSRLLGHDLPPIT